MGYEAERKEKYLINLRLISCIYIIWLPYAKYW